MLLTEEDRWEIRGHDEQESASFTSDGEPGLLPRSFLKVAPIKYASRKTLKSLAADEVGKARSVPRLPFRLRTKAVTLHHQN